ncbi:hypothetical protein WJX73_004830 [Symbiochloris irregularis]|uniref:Uncharacterized protein n=1 Tax=Symbiochloris irregularis TaxID=706552 RepID=A0AAW1NM37_9CHLO
MPSPLFLPFRALGYITDDVPFAVQRRGRETFVTVSVGKTWQVYNCSKLRLALVGPQLPHQISALASKGDLTFAAVGAEVVACQRVHRIGTYCGHTSAIIQLLCLGNILLSLGADQKVCVWRIGQYNEPEAVLELGSAFGATCMTHPDTYLDKVVVAGTKGQLQLWNFSTSRKLYDFALADAAVSHIASSPALDVVAVGLADGRVMLHNLKFDEHVAAFANAAGVGVETASLLKDSGMQGGRGRAKHGSCTAVSFSTGPGIPMMAAGGASGAITVWNLEARKLHTIIRDAHAAPLTALHFFPGEPRLMSAGADNTLKQWVFDSADNSARLLRFRGGHAAPPTIVQHYGSDGSRLLSAGHDRAFRLFSVIQDQQSRELSQHHVTRRAKRARLDPSELKLPQLTVLDACQARERDWCNVVTAHEGDSAAYTWRLQHYTLGQHVLRPPQGPDAPAAPPMSSAGAGAPVTAVAMSHCGNFALVGSVAGRLDRYNIQSGLHRGSYCRDAVDPAVQPTEPQTNTMTHLERERAHVGAVTGIAVDGANSTMVSVGLDAALLIWDFKSRKLAHQLRLPAAASRLAHHPGTGMVAVGCDDLGLYMYDAAAARLVRRFRGHTDRITGLCISEDGAWLLSGSMDGTLRVHDIPSGRVLQVLRMGPAITGISLAPDAIREDPAQEAEQELDDSQPLTPNLDDIGVDSSFYATSDDSGDEGPSRRSHTDQQAGGLQETVHPLRADPMAPKLVTMSLLPAQQWQSLLHLEEIKERNKPKEPPKQPPSAPFFLPTIPSHFGQPQFTQEAAPTSSNDHPPTASTPEALLSLLAGLSPLEVDKELRSLQATPGTDEEEELQQETDDIALLLQFMAAALEAGQSFDLIQGLLALTLQLHGPLIQGQARLLACAEALKATLQQVWGERLDPLLQSTRCMIGFLAGTVG